MWPFKEKEPLVAGGHYRFYQSVTSNPFDRSHYVTIIKIEGDWILFQFSDTGNSSSESQTRFRELFRPAALRPDEIEDMDEDPIFTEDYQEETT